MKGGTRGCCGETGNLGWGLEIPRLGISKGSFPFQNPLPPSCKEWQGQLAPTRGRRKGIPVLSLVS